ncbi:MAG: serine/threonine-protein kinase [Deltaproteobacteria bacterium]|nr:serine/threonine-protein kinase [Deltaproteobacteria bacterium]
MSSDPSSTSSESFPRWFGDYVLLKSLGHGGMGQVFLARLPGLQGIERLCVLKTLRPQWMQDREYVSRFVDEARVVVALAHRNICPVFDVGSFLGTYYLAMDLVPGRDLSAVFLAAQGRGGVPVDVALFIAIEIVDALDAAHRLLDPETGEPVNLVHRDVSPHNVLCSFDGEVKLIDFGLAHSSLKHERTEPGIVLGKLAYMAPEHARGDAVDRRADLFAVGVVLYELLVGERYWEGLTTQQVWQVVGRGTHTPAKMAALPDGVREVVQKAVSARAQDRYATGAEMRQALVQVQLARGVVSGSAELRAHLETLFPGAAAADRKERALLAKLKVPDANAAGDSSVRIASASGPKAPAPPPSIAARSARAIPVHDPDEAPTLQTAEPKLDNARTDHDAALQSSTSSLPNPAVGPESSESSSGPLATEVVHRRPVSKAPPQPPVAHPGPALPPAPARLPLGIVAVVVVGVLIAFAVSRGPDDQPVVDAGARAVEASVDAGAPAVALAIVDAIVVVDAGVADVVVVVVDAGVAEVVVDAGAVVRKPLEPRKPKPLPPPAEMPRGLNKLGDLLAERCARVACTPELRERIKGADAMAPADIASLRAAVNTCLETCRQAR